MKRLELERLASKIMGTDKVSASARRAYVVFGSRRTGSTRLCSVLRDHGLGRPREHDKALDGTFLREETKACVSSPESYSVLLCALAARETGPVFGTKILSFFTEMLGLDPRDVATVLAMLEWAVIFVHRRDLVAQSVSLWLAEQRSCWSIMSERQQRAQLEDMPPYDYAALEQSYQDAQREARYAMLVRECLPSDLVYDVEYGSFDDQISGALEHLGSTYEGHRGRVLVSRNRISENYADRFRRELAAREKAASDSSLASDIIERLEDRDGRVLAFGSANGMTAEIYWSRLSKSYVAAQWFHGHEFSNYGDLALVRIPERVKVFRTLALSEACLADACEVVAYDQERGMAIVSNVEWLRVNELLGSDCMLWCNHGALER